MNSEERAALVEELENLFAWSWGKDLKTGRQVLAELGDDPAQHHRRETMFANKAVEIFDRLLADRAAESQLLLDEANRQIVQLRNAFGNYVADRAATVAEPDAEPINAVYRERNQVVAALSKCFYAWIGDVDDAEPGWSQAVYIDLPTGQVSWHVADDEMQELFGHLKVSGEPWDGHTTEEKYSRLAALSTTVAEPDADVIETVAKAMWRSGENSMYPIWSKAENDEEWQAALRFYQSEGYDAMGSFPAFQLAKTAIAAMPSGKEAADER